MATRRARIKAVTSLPPRRKNNDGADNSKARILEEVTVDKPLKSPRTPRGVKTQENLDKSSPQRGSPLKSPRPEISVIKNLTDRVPSPLVAPKVSKELAVTPKRESVFSSIYTLKPNVFISPKSVGRKPVASPLVQTSTVEINVQRITPITPEKLPEKSKKKNAVCKTIDVDKSDEKSKESSKETTNTKVSKGAEKSDVPEDENVPSVPESITEDAVMDGIVPLQAVAAAPKPLALLKNEIISENAEVLFDPIVPLPSPSKVRPKLRPVPRLAPLRRNSIQGSASESEDENRRALLSGGSSTPAPPRQRHDSHTSHSTMHSLPNREVNRIRNDSVCSSISQATQPQVTASPVKEKHLTKTRRLELSRRMAAMRRRRETVKKDALTMYDLIFYNPTGNPIVPDKDEMKAKEANEKEQAVRKAAKDAEEAAKDQPEEDAAPVPQIKLGPNGEIMLDEQSLVIKQSDKRKVSSDVVHEGAWGGSVNSGRYRRTPRTADWSDAETVRFYRALAALGTDFMLMERLFPGRTRRDLKLKFKKEERVNMAQVDKALRTTAKWDATKLENEFKAEREAAERRARIDAEHMRKRAREERQRLRLARELRVRMSRGSKAMDSSCLPSAIYNKANDGLTADDVIRRHNEAKARKRKPKEPEPQHPQTSAKLQPDLEFASLTRVPKTPLAQDRRGTTGMATLHKLDPTKSHGKTPDQKQPQTSTPQVPANIENGSLVVLTVDDPNSPSKKMLQTYIASGGGRLTPVALPASFLNSVVTYMKKGTPKSNNMSAGSSPHLTSPSSVASQDSRPCSTPGIIQMNGSPAKRQRHSSYTITQL